MSSTCHHLRRPLGFHLRPQRLKRRRVGAVHDARARLRRRRVRTFGRRRNQRLDELVAEADDLVDAHVAADHAVGQARLKRLIDDAAVGGEIRLAARHEIAASGIVFGHAAPARLQHANDARRAGRLGRQLDLPDALTAIAAVLLEDTRARRSKPRRKRVAERARRCGRDGCRCPSRDAWCDAGPPSRPS